MVTDEKDTFQEDDLHEENSGSEPLSPEKPGSPKRVRVRVKVKKKIRIKKKQGTKKTFKKVAERIFWILIILGFFASLIIMVVELEVKDDKFKQQRKKTSPIRYQSLNSDTITETENNSYLFS